MIIDSAFKLPLKITSWRRRDCLKYRRLYLEMGNFWEVNFLFDLTMIYLQLLVMAALIVFSLVLVVVTIYLHPEKADNLQPLQSDHILNVVSPIFWNYWIDFLKKRMIREVLLTINIDYYLLLASIQAAVNIIFSTLYFMLTRFCSPPRPVFRSLRRHQIMQYQVTIFTYVIVVSKKTGQIVAVSKDFLGRC